MSLLKAFACQVILLGTYKLFLEHIFEDYLVPDELTRNCLVGFVCLLCFGIQLYTEKVEDQTGHAEASKAKSDRRTPLDTPDTFSEFLDARTAHMMRTLDEAMQHMGQMPMSDGYVQNVIFAAAGPEAAVIEQTFGKQPDVVLVEEIHVTKLGDAIYANEKSDIFANEPIVIPVKVEEIEEKHVKNETEEEEVEEETETKSDVCEEEEEDVVTVIDASKQKSEDKTKTATESEEEEEEVEEEEEEEEVEEEEEEKEESVIADNKKDEKTAEKKPLEIEVEEEEDEEEEEEESVIADNKKDEKKAEKKPLEVEVEEEEDEEQESEEEQDEAKQKSEKMTKKS